MPNKIKNYRYQLFPSEELIRLVREAVRVSRDPKIHTQCRGWFAALVRAALTCYIADCKATNKENGA